MTNILCLGDLHLGRLETLFASNWQKWSLAPFKQAVKYAIRNKIKYIIQVGDVFDTPNPSQEWLLLLITYLKTVNAKHPELQIYFILGNHDKLDKKTNSLLLLKYLSRKYHLKNCHIFTKAAKVIIDKVTVVFLPWPMHTSKLLDKPSLVIAHVERKGARYDSGKLITDNDFDLGDHYWVIGHLHETQKTNQALWLGAPLQLRYSDSKNKYMWNLAFKGDNPHPVSVKKIPIKLPYTLEMVRVNSLVENEWQRKLQHLPENAYIKLQVNSQIVLPIKYLRHPRVSVEYFGTKVSVTSSGRIETNVNNSQKSRKIALKQYLQKYGLNEKRIKLALKMSQKFENNLVY